MQIPLNWWWIFQLSFTNPRRRPINAPYLWPFLLRPFGILKTLAFQREKVNLTVIIQSICNKAIEYYSLLQKFYTPKNKTQIKFVDGSLLRQMQSSSMLMLLSQIPSLLWLQQLEMLLVRYLDKIECLVQPSIGQSCSFSLGITDYAL